MDNQRHTSYAPAFCCVLCTTAYDKRRIQFSRINAALIAFIINYSAYFSEIYRGGIESVPKGQYEAGQVLGMTKPQIFFKVVLMQVVKKITAPIGNEIITLVRIHHFQALSLFLKF